MKDILKLINNYSLMSGNAVFLYKRILGTKRAVSVFENDKFIVCRTDMNYFIQFEMFGKMFAFNNLSDLKRSLLSKIEHFKIFGY